MYSLQLCFPCGQRYTNRPRRGGTACADDGYAARLRNFASAALKTAILLVTWLRDNGLCSVFLFLFMWWKCHVSLLPYCLSIYVLWLFYELYSLVCGLVFWLYYFLALRGLVVGSGLVFWLSAFQTMLCWLKTYYINYVYVWCIWQNRD
jgi:hypothetical protein